MPFPAQPQQYSNSDSQLPSVTLHPKILPHEALQPFFRVSLFSVPCSLIPGEVMIRQILEVFFLAQVVTEAVVESSEKAIKDATDQLQQMFAPSRHNTRNGNHRVEAAVEATKKDYEQVV